MSDLRVCVFQLGDQHFGVPLESIVEIVPMEGLSKPPSMPPILEGVLNLRGKPVPVLRVAALFGLASVPPDTTPPLIVIRWAHTRLALLVDRAIGVVSVNDEPAAPAKPTNQNGHADRYFVAYGETVQMLPLDRLLTDGEKQLLGKLAAGTMTPLDEFSAAYS